MHTKLDDQPSQADAKDLLSAFKRRVAHLNDQLDAAKQTIAERDATIAHLEDMVGRVTADWAEVDELAEALKDKLALSEAAVGKFAGDYLTEASRNFELEMQIAALREEIAMLRNHGESN